MEGEPPAPDSVTVQNRPIQFTVRTFFVAAVFVALFFSALRIPWEGLAAAASGLVACVALAGLFGLLRSFVPLATMFVAALFCTLCFLAVMVVSAMAETRHWLGDNGLELVAVSVPAGLWYGVGMSALVAIVRGLAALITGLMARLTGRAQHRKLPFRRRGSGWKIGLAMAASGVLLALAPESSPAGPYSLAPMIVRLFEAIWAAIHLPLVPLAFVLGPADFMGSLIIVAILCIPYWMGMAWCVRRLADRLAKWEESRALKRIAQRAERRGPE